MEGDFLFFGKRLGDIKLCLRFRAQAVIEAFADPENAGKGVLKVNGKMTELLHLAEAKRLVAVSEAIEAMQG